MAFRDLRHRGRAPAPPALASSLKRFYALRFAVTAMTMLSAVLLPWIVWSATHRLDLAALVMLVEAAVRLTMSLYGGQFAHAAGGPARTRILVVAKTERQRCLVRQACAHGSRRAVRADRCVFDPRLAHPAQDVADQHRGQRDEVAQPDAGRPLQLQHHDRDDDRHHPVGEGGQPLLAHAHRDLTR